MTSAAQKTALQAAIATLSTQINALTPDVVTPPAPPAPPPPPPPPPPPAGGAQGLTPVNPVTTAMAAAYNVRTDADALAVPWGTLAPGAVVNIFYKSTPYKVKIGLRAQGTQALPVILHGVTDAAGNRPVFDFANAKTAPTCSNVFSTTPAYGESLGGIVIKRGTADAYAGPKPSWITIRNLELRNASGPYVTMTGAAASMGDAGNIYIHVGADITIDNCISTSAPFGLFVMAKDVELAQACERITLQNSRLYGNGVVGQYLQHNVYMQSTSPRVIGNYLGKLKAGALGSTYKSRSSDERFSNNYVVASARAIDLVHSEDQANGIAAQPLYGTDYVYGNTIVSDGPEFIHYGGDNMGEQGPEAAIFVPPLPYRKKLYFYGNVCTQTSAAWRVMVFMLSAKETTAEAWGNTFNLAFTGGGQVSWLNFAGQIKLGANTMTGAAPTDARDGSINDGRFLVTRNNAPPF